MIRAPLRRRRIIANASLVALILMCGMLLLVPPTQSTLYPVCPVHTLFGIDCPGCGATRALAALLRGHIREALRLNGLFVVLLPIALAIAAECYRRAIRAGTFRWPQLPMTGIYAAFAATAIFTIARNLK